MAEPRNQQQRRKTTASVESLAQIVERETKPLPRLDDRVAVVGLGYSGLPLAVPDAAEMAKLLENVFGYVNIAFVNQLALLCERMGLDVWEVIDGASTKPFGFVRFTPGPGVGGHCIAVDSYYLSWRARGFGFIDRFIEAASDINAVMPRPVVDLVAEAPNDRSKALKGARVGILGMAFKPDIRGSRNSAAEDVLAGLTERGADVRFHDPHVAAFRDSKGTERETVDVDRIIDRSMVYAQADLVVDAVNDSETMLTKPHQVLRMGAGWSGT